jgi:hypothetical protein
MHTWFATKSLRIYQSPGSTSSGRISPKPSPPYLRRARGSVGRQRTGGCARAVRRVLKAEGTLPPPPTNPRPRAQ